VRLLVLWDIDHTLLVVPGFGRLVYSRAFPAVVGKPLGELVHMAGRPDLDIMAETLKLNGITPTDELLGAMSEAVVREFTAVADELRDRGRLLPGAREALAGLVAEPGIHQSVLTGNLREVARLKLDAFGLLDYLDLDSGAFGGDHASRPELVGIARKRAAARTGVSFEGEATVLVGDTPRDVVAAVTTGARIIAVATGSYSVAELRAAGAPVVLTGLDECAELLREMAART
jgi:phosphoglycolate phosphatase